MKQEGGGWYEFIYQDPNTPQNPHNTIPQRFLLRDPDEITRAVQELATFAMNDDWKEYCEYFDPEQFHWKTHGKQPLIIMPETRMPRNEYQALLKDHWIRVYKRNPARLTVRAPDEPNRGEVRAKIRPDLHMIVYPQFNDHVQAEFKRAEKKKLLYANLGLGTIRYVLPRELVEAIAAYDWKQHTTEFKTGKGWRQRALLGTLEEPYTSSDEIRPLLN